MKWFWGLVRVVNVLWLCLFYATAILLAMIGVFVWAMKLADKRSTTWGATS